MKSYTIYRGVDNEIEFRGLRGKHFYYAVICVIVVIFTGLFMYMLGISPILALLFLSITGSGGLWLIFRNNKRHGRWGDVKQVVSVQKPFFVCQQQSFRKLITVQNFSKRTVS